MVHMLFSPTGFQIQLYHRYELWNYVKFGWVRLDLFSYVKIRWELTRPQRYLPHKKKQWRCPLSLVSERCSEIHVFPTLSVNNKNCIPILRNMRLHLCKKPINIISLKILSNSSSILSKEVHVLRNSLSLFYVFFLNLNGNFCDCCLAFCVCYLSLSPHIPSSHKTNEKINCNSLAAVGRSKMLAATSHPIVAANLLQSFVRGQPHGSLREKTSWVPRSWARGLGSHLQSWKPMCEALQFTVKCKTIWNLYHNDQTVKNPLC